MHIHLPVTLLGTVVHLLSHVSAEHCMKLCRHESRVSVSVYVEHQDVETKQCDHLIWLLPLQGSLSISDTDDLQGS